MPGALGFLVAEHGRYYARDWGFDASFEARIAEGLGAFMLRYDAAGGDRLLIAHDCAGDGAQRFLGGLALDFHDPDTPGEARLRWFILGDGARGKGVGGLLMAAAMAHLDQHGMACSLGTFAGLDAARTLYERHGFALVSETEAATWGPLLREQVFGRSPANV